MTYQLKILTTALFSVALLNKTLSRLQWLALLILFAGVSVIQLEEKSADQAVPGTTPRPLSVTTGANVPTTPFAGTTLHPDIMRKQNKLIGLSTALVAVCMSGFAGVYFEKVLKGSEVTVWLRNVQLSVLAIPMSIVTMYAKDGAELQQHGLLYGYDGLVWGIVLLYALGGLTVAAVVKYADNILKGFATSVSILLSCVVSTFLFDFHPSVLFLLGLLMVFSAIYMYSKPVASS